MCTSFSEYNADIIQQIPLTNPYPGPRSVLILDNCNIHHAEEIRQLVEDEACKFCAAMILYLGSL